MDQLEQHSRGGRGEMSTFYRRCKTGSRQDIPKEEQLVVTMREMFGDIFGSMRDHEILPVASLCVEAIRRGWRTVPSIDEIGIPK